MVDSVSSLGGKIRTAAPTGIAAGAGANGASVAQTGAAARAQPSKGAGGDVLSISANALDLPAELKLGPPIDTAQVGKIKQAIASGNYPINVDAIKDAMLQAWHETVN
jgi:negative regulator of flagellin synthesis FlgM